MTSLLAAWFGLAAPVLHASLRRDMGDMIHPMGRDALNLDVVDRDDAGRILLERRGDAASVMERKTQYHSNGNRAFQSTTLRSRQTGRRISLEKEAWNPDGILESRFSQSDGYDQGGRRVSGLVLEKTFKNALLTMESRRRFNVESGSWELVYLQTLSYYPGGDLKERITRQPLAREELRETWGVKGPLGREQLSQRWNPSKQEWEQAYVQP